MKKICLLLFLWLVTAITAGACVVVFDPTIDVGTGSTTAGPYCIEKDGISVCISNGIVSANHYRVYKNSTITICSTMGEITSIEFECTAQDDAQYGPGNFVTSAGSYSYEGYTGLWEGRETCVTFIAEGNQVRLTKIVVTFDCAAVMPPVIRPASGTYYNPIEVTMTCPTSGAHIYYTTNGSNPTPASTPYMAPFTLSAGTTVKAVAVLDDEISDVTAATYEFLEATEVSCLSDALLAPDGEVIFIPNPVTVLAQNNKYLFVRDMTAYALIYGNTGQTYVQGDIIPGGFYVTKSFYNGEPEFSDPQGFQPAIGNTPVEPEEISGGIGHELFAHYVVLHNVSIVKNGTQYIIIDEDGNEYPAYFGSMGFPAPNDLTARYDVYAMVGSYGRENTIYQLLPIWVDRMPPIEPIGFGDFFDIVADPENPNPEVTMGYDATVLHQQGNYLYAKDETGFGMVYGSVGNSYLPGDVIPAGFGGKVKEYDCHPELEQPTGFQPAIGHVELVPEEITLDQLDDVHWGHYVVIKHVKFDLERRVLYDDNGNETPYYNRFYVNLPADLSLYYDVYGIVDSYSKNCIYELLITDWFPKPIPGLIPCLEDLYDLPQGVIGQFSLPLIVVYQNGPNLYVKDTCGQFGLIYGNVGGTFAMGDSIIGYASWTTYQGARQLTPAEPWSLVGHGPEVEPEEMPIEELSQDMAHWYLYFEDVKIVLGEDGSLYIDDGIELLKIWDKFHVQVEPGHDGSYYYPCDVNCDGEVTIADVNAIIDVILNGLPEGYTLRDLVDDIDFDATYDIWGFLTLYRYDLELYPTRIVKHGYGIPWPIDDPRYFDVNGDGEVTIADVNWLIDWILSH